MRNAALRLSVIVAVVLFAGCTVLANRDNANHFVTTYVLTGTTGAGPPPHAIRTDHILVVEMPGAVPGFATPAMAYVTKPFRLDYYADHRWADTPGHMLRPLLIEALQESGLFRAVVDPKAPVSGNLRLSSEVLALQQVYHNGESSIEFRLAVDIFDVARQRLLAHRVFAVTEPAESTPYGGAVAANRAVAVVIKALVDYLSRQVPMASQRTPGIDGDTIGEGAR